MNEFKFLNENIISSSNFKGLSPTTPSLERESFVKVAGFTIHEMNLLSTLKRDCEKYLFIRGSRGRDRCRLDKGY